MRPAPSTAAAARPARSGAERRVLLGILFICLSGLLFPVMNGVAKLLGAH